MNTVSNLDNTTNCPRETGCRQCGSTDDLDVATYETPIGVFCGTLCGACAVAGHQPHVPAYGESLRVVVTLVFEHCIHLGITVDEMAAALEAERTE